MMNEHLATVVIALIGGIVSIVTIIIQKNNSGTIKDINDQMAMIEDENELKKKIDDIKKGMEDTIYNMQILLVDTNICMLNDNHDLDKIKSLTERADELKKNYVKLNEKFDEYLKEYQMVLKYNSALQRGLQQNRTNKEDK